MFQALLLAQAQAQVQPAPSSPTDWTTILYNTGVVGVFMVLILIGRLWTKGSYDEMKAQRDLAMKIADEQKERADRADETIRSFTSQGELMSKLLTSLREVAERPAK